MSYETWRQKFYPVEAKDCREGDAVAHSLLKWEGLRPDALDDHGLEVRVSIFTPTIFEVHEDVVRDGVVVRNKHPALEIDGISCALCVHHAETGCPNCPIVLATGKACDRWSEDDDETPVYMHFKETNDPEPMIHVLRQALDYVQK